ncbi:protein TPX2 [Cocos nucifera]|uniref:Protein TPX2 n=1 Tax=Cocos nucifera TaxID=13894 RepID=A0A8K0IAZ8_COCNU|nr:protein TPX2 [Cocos nucifera]
MEDPSKLTSPKSSKIAPPSSNTKRGVKNSQLQPFRLQTEQRGQIKEQALAKRVQELVAEEAKLRIPVAQGLPLTTDKPQSLPKPPVKQTKPLNIKLHTEQRAARRAGFNNLVSSKNYSLEILRRFEEKLLKVIEEEEIRIMRKEMVPKAQLMPIFDRPFLPQRSTRPLTVPREPSFHFLKQKSCSSGEPYKIHQHVNQNMKAVK